MIYFIQEYGGDHCIKIGFTDGPVEVRLASLQTGNPHRLEVLATMPGDRSDEERLHGQFASAITRADGEWFFPVPPLIRFIGSIISNSAIVTPPVTPMLPVSPIRKAAEWLVLRFREKNAWHQQELLSLSRSAKMKNADVLAAVGILGIHKGETDFSVYSAWPLLTRGLDQYPSLEQDSCFAVHCCGSMAREISDGDTNDWATAHVYVRENADSYPRWPIHCIKCFVSVPDHLEPARRVLRDIWDAGFTAKCNEAGELTVSRHGSSGVPSGLADKIDANCPGLTTLVKAIQDAMKQ